MAIKEQRGRHSWDARRSARSPLSRRRIRAGAAISAAAALVVITAALVLHGAGDPAQPLRAAPGHRGSGLATTPGSYIGLYSAQAPASYSGVTAFTSATGVKPGVLLYYSGWFEPFRTGFARTAVSEGAVPLVQINPDGISVAAIASGKYDGYLSAYAEAVRAYHQPVILSFGHEMNGYWYSWGYGHTSPTVFVAAWRHIVTVFRTLGARNVTWLWTVNIVDDPQHGKIPSPAQWWPGRSYVTWVGIDGYYSSPSTAFSSLFGPTIAIVREMTRAPILISETAAVPAAGQPAKISDLFAGIRLYGLLGFVWFDAVHAGDWRLTSPRALAAFRRNAETYLRPAK